MKLSQPILSILSKYFAKQESPEERRTLYKWYEEIQSGAVVDEQRIAHLKAENAEKLFALTKPKKTLTLKRVMRYAAAAAMLVGIGYFGYQYYQDSYTHILDQEELAAIGPGANKAIITLASGEIIDLEDIGLNDSILIGNNIIRKDAQGLVSYHMLEQQLPSEDVQSTLQTPKAGQYIVVLADGTKVTLNAESKLSYPTNFIASERRVTLSGEAFFEVSKTADKRKFIVETKNQTTEVLGTKFNIQAYEDEKQTITTLAEGLVRIQDKASKKVLLLQPNEQTILDESGLSKSNIDADAAIGWAKGYFYFDKNNAREVVQQIARWYDIEVEFVQKSNIIYAGKIPKNLHLGKLIELLDFADIKAKAVSNRKNETKLIIN